jgi:hypothetical protein
VAQLEAAASLEIAQVARQKISKSQHWRDAAELYLKLPNIIAARRSLVGAQ